MQEMKTVSQTEARGEDYLAQGRSLARLYVKESEPQFSTRGGFDTGETSDAASMGRGGSWEVYPGRA